MASGDTPSLRRNGRVPSCEPCRKSKLACDHTRPVCRRCQARGKQRVCSYHPAPMTGMGKKARMARESADRSPSDDQHSPSISFSPSSGPNVCPNMVNARTPFARTASGYLGAVSYLGPLSESQKGFAAGYDHEDDVAEDSPALAHDIPHLEEGERVLRTLWPLSQIDKLLADIKTQFCCLGPDTIIVSICHSLKECFGDTPNKPPEKQQLRTLAAAISDNTAKRIKPAGKCSMEEYATSFTGANLRWEALGLIFSRLSLHASPLGTNGIWAANIKYHAYWKCLIEATNLCLSLCDVLGSMNDLTFWFMYENYVSLTLFHGDSGYVPWKRLGDLSSALFALGLHLDINVTPKIPRWLAEIRKLCVLSAFMADKTMACFVGRPPRINGRYCALQIPLALTHTQLALPVDELEELIPRMGDDVYRFNKTTDFAAGIAHSLPVMVHREKILELFLCRPYTQTDAKTTVQQIMDESASLWESRPAIFRYSPDVWDSGQTAHECYIALMTHLDHEYNDFLLQRYRVQRLHADSDELLRLSNQLLSDALILVALRDKVGGGYCDIPWMLALFALPAAGVLALALLRSAQNHTPSSKAFSRSEVIQNLSVLAGALDWVATPGVGNFTLCQQARNMLRRIIDKILDPGDDETALDSVAPMAQSVPNFENEDISWLGATNPADELWNNLEEYSLLMFNPANNNWH